MEVAMAHKEVLAWLFRIGQLAQKALKNLNSGNPYDAIRIIKIIAKLDANALAVITRVPNYETHVRQAHIELVNECRAILTLSSEALQLFSPELQNWPAEKLAKVRATFEEALTELGRELKAEEGVKYWLSEAERAFGQPKAWTYSRLGLERAVETLDFLVKDENAMNQTMGRYSTVFRGVKHPNPNQFLQDLLKRRLRVRAAAKYVLDNAFKDGFAFELNRPTWRSMLNEVSHLPEENVKELNMLKEQLLQSAIFAKRNVSYPKLSQVLNRVIGISRHARAVERAIEAAEAASKETGKNDEQILKEHWESKVHNGFVYHGTSSIFLPNIERFGLTSEGIFSEGTPFKVEDYEFFLKVSRKAYGANVPHLEYFTQDVTQGFFLDANYNFAVGYAKQGPERIRFMLEHLRDIKKDVESLYPTESQFLRAKVLGRVSQQEINKLLEILRRYESVMSHHRPVVLHIPMSSPALMKVLSQNGLTSVVRLVTDYSEYKRIVFYYLTGARTGGGNPALAVPALSLTSFLERNDPLTTSFHNIPLKGTILGSSIAKVEYV